VYFLDLKWKSSRELVDAFAPTVATREGFGALTRHSMGHWGRAQQVVGAQRQERPFLALLSKPSVFADSEWGVWEARELKTRRLRDAGGLIRRVKFR
jgi:hypothetical protein